jgi:apolipoprotein N-acyltransferase
MHFRPWLLAGTRPVVMQPGEHAFGVLVCYDDVVPGPSEELRAAGARVLVTVTNEAWFGRGELRQHAALAAVRCIETRLPMARCGNDGLTCVIDARGRVTASLPAWTEGVLVADVPPPDDGERVAASVRDAVDWAAVVALGALVLVTLRRKDAA